MKQQHATLFDNGDFSLHARIGRVISPKDGYSLTIASKRQESRHPQDEQVRFFACLDRRSLEALSELLLQALARFETDGREIGND